MKVTLINDSDKAASVVHAEYVTLVPEGHAEAVVFSDQMVKLMPGSRLIVNLARCAAVKIDSEASG